MVLTIKCEFLSKKWGESEKIMGTKKNRGEGEGGGIVNGENNSSKTLKKIECGEGVLLNEKGGGEEEG